LTGEGKLKKEILLLFLWGFLFFYLLSLLTYSPLDPSFNSSGIASGKVINKAGLVGAYLAGLFFDLFGLGAFLWALSGFLVSLLIIKNITFPWYRWTFFFLLLILLHIWISFPYFSFVSFHSISGGGFLGNNLYLLCIKYFKFWGSIVILSILTICSIQIVFNISWYSLIYKLKYDFIKRKERISKNIKRNNKKKNVDKDISPVKEGKKEVKESGVKKDSKNNINYVHSGDAKFPPLDILNEVVKNKVKVSKEILEEIGLKVTDCLANFSIEGKVERVVPGPVVSMVEFKPAPGIKISKIANLSDDLALSLKSSRVRIIAPLPGKDTVGIEIPNPEREMVFLKEVLDTPGFQNKKHILPLALGKDIQGNAVVVDLAKMPHLLVAGATGAGKSVCLNSFLLSLLFAHTPDSLRLLLIDPKRIELSVYNDLPHLVHPVVTEPGMAKVALEWAVAEMERRYELMAQLGVRNIEAYNQKISNLKKSEDNQEEWESLFYLVIIIDEMADLMLTGAKEVETSIVRLAQLARAAGIHLILATQRPSVDVVTGIIKANFPARIAFQVSSKHDSRTILDANGAEYLLGKGDMLFKASGGSLKRVHGAFVSEEEIAQVVEFWKESYPGSFELDFKQWKEEKEEKTQSEVNEDIVNDPKYQEAVEFAIETGKVSISLIQRRFRIGFNKAALFIEQMERDGIIGPPEGSKPREVLIKKH